MPSGRRLVDASGTPGDLGIRDLGGSSNLNLLVDHAGRPVVVRVYLPWVGPTRLNDLQRIRALSRDNFLPIPEHWPSDHKAVLATYRLAGPPLHH